MSFSRYTVAAAAKELDFYIVLYTMTTTSTHGVVSERFYNNQNEDDTNYKLLRARLCNFQPFLRPALKLCFF